MSRARQWLEDFQAGDRRKTYGGVALTGMMLSIPWTIGPTALGPTFGLVLDAVAILAAIASASSVLVEVDAVRQRRLLEENADHEDVERLLAEAEGRDEAEAPPTG